MNPQQKRQITMLCGAIILVGGVWFFMFRTPAPDSVSPGATSQDASGTVPATAPPTAGDTGAPRSRIRKVTVNIDQLIAKIQEENREASFDYDKERSKYPRNPMTPLVPPKNAGGGPEGTPDTGIPIAPGDLEALAKQMRVSGIIWDKRSPIAIVQDEVVTQGYKFPSGIVVEAIEPDRVTLRANNTPVSIELNPKEQ